MRMRRRIWGAAAAFAAVALPSAASAAQTISVKLTNGTTRSCTVTALTPSVNRTTKIITTSVSVKCTSTGSISLLLQVVEMDGSNEDPMVQVPEFRKDVSITKANTATTFSYATAYKCVSTESDNEELATKAKVGIGTTWSATDRIAQSSNTSLC